VLLNRVYIVLLALSCCIINGCGKHPKAEKKDLFVKPESGTILIAGLKEISGIVDSKTYPSALWVEQDSGNPPDLSLISYDGRLLKTCRLKNAINRDWEDVAAGPGPVAGLRYLFLADIGDNDTKDSTYFIYRFPEPATTTDTIRNWEKLTFRYPDGSHDAEALFVDQESRDIYIITKRDAVSKVYMLPFPQPVDTVITAVPVMDLPFSGAVSAAISADNRELIIKTYTALNYWVRATGMSTADMLKKESVQLPYLTEPQGEAVTFKNDGTGFFTISEKGLALTVSLYWYRRN